MEAATVVVAAIVVVIYDNGYKNPPKKGIQVLRNRQTDKYSAVLHEVPLLKSNNNQPQVLDSRRWSSSKAIR